MEKFNRTIKRIAALTGGAVMVGAALSGALAQLDKLPAPFVTSAGVMDSYVVVGTMGWNPDIAFNAAAASGLAQDIAVGIDVGAAFAQKATTGASGTGSSTVSGGVQVKAPGEDLNYGEDIATVDGIYGDGDLAIFADNTFKESKGATKNDIDYTQKIEITAATGDVIFDINTEDDNEPADTFVKFNDITDMYTYTINFPAKMKYDGAAVQNDLKGSKITLQGATYTISEATAAGGKIDNIVLMSGSLTATQGEYTTQTYTMNGKDYEIEVLIIADNTGDVKFKVNGETTDALVAGDTYELSDGTEIGVDEVMPNEGSEAAGADQVTFFLGANKLTLEDGQAVLINDAELEDWDTFVTYTANIDELSSIAITAKPNDDQFVAAGGNVVDPIFGKWMVSFTGLEKTTEDWAFSAGADKGKIKFTSNANKAIEIPLVYDVGSGNVVLGSSYDYADGTKATVDTAGTGNEQAMLLGDADTCTGAAGDAENCEGILILVTSLGGEARVFELANVQLGATQTYDLKDKSTSKVYEDLAFGVAQDIGVITDFELSNAIAATNIDNYGGATTADFETSKVGVMELQKLIPVAKTVNVVLTDDDAVIMGDFQFEENNAGDDMEIDAGNANDLLANLMPKVADSDTYVGIDLDDWGMIATYDNENKDTLDVKYPEERVIADVWIAPSGASATAATSGAVNVNYINAATGVARTDADFASAVPTKNVILIGGPSVNELVKDLADANKTQAASAYAADSAIVQLVADAFGSNDALVIAGYASKDTKLAGQVVAANLLQGQFSDKMTGSKVTINTAGATTVSGVSFA